MKARLGREAESQYFRTTRCRGSGFARRLRGSSKIERGALDSPLGEAPLYLPRNLVPHRWQTPGRAVCRRTTRRRALESAARLLRPRSTKAGRDINARRGAEAGARPATISAHRHPSSLFVLASTLESVLGVDGAAMLTSLQISFLRMDVR